MKGKLAVPFKKGSPNLFEQLYDVGICGTHAVVLLPCLHQVQQILLLLPDVGPGVGKQVYQVVVVDL